MSGERLELWIDGGEMLGVVGVPVGVARRRIETEMAQPMAVALAGMLGVPVVWGEPEAGHPLIRLGTAWPDGRVAEHGFA